MSAAAIATRIVEADWWEQDGEELANTLGTVFRIVSDEQQWRTDADEYHWGLYEGTGMGGVTVRSRKNLTYAGATLPDNICKMSVDTLTAKVATIRPIPQVQASRGNWSDQRRARKMRQLIEGAFYQHKIHEQAAKRIIKDAQVSRAGVVQVDADGKRTSVQRVHPWTLFTDEWDAEFGEPLTIMRLHTKDRATAVRLWGKTKELKEKIKNATRFSRSTQILREEDRSSTVERVELLEAWHRCMADHDDEDDDHECTGKHVIICDGAVLFSEDWPHEFFPFATLTYDTPNTGYWGSGVVQTLEGYQVSINEANCKLDQSYSASGKGVITFDNSGITPQQIQNGFTHLQCRPGINPPMVFDMDLVNEHMRARPSELIERGLNAVGVSQLAAQSKKPDGVDAGIALQTLDDIESQRHIVFGRSFEAWCLDVARLLIEAVKKIAKRYGDYAVKVPLKGAYLPLKWSEVKIDGYQLMMQSVGQLYMSFAGKLDKLKTLFEMGAIDKGTFMRYLDAGDIQAELDLETVDKLAVDEMLEAMLDAPANDNGKDSYLAPHEYLPLEWAKRRAHQKRLQAQIDGAPEYVLSLLGRFIDDCDYLLQKKAAGEAALAAKNAPPPPPPPPAPGPPGGMPMAPPDMPMATAPAGDQLMQPPPLAA